MDMREAQQELRQKSVTTARHCRADADDGIEGDRQECRPRDIARPVHVCLPVSPLMSRLLCGSRAANISGEGRPDLRGAPTESYRRRRNIQNPLAITTESNASRPHSVSVGICLWVIGSGAKISSVSEPELSEYKVSW